MKILMITSRIPFPLKDGGAIATYNHIKGFYASGNEVTLLSLNTLKHFVDKKTINETLSKIATVITYDIDTNLTKFGVIKSLFASQSYNVSRFIDIGFSNLIKNIILENQFDIIQIDGLYVSYYVNVCRENSCIPIVLRQHNVEFEIWEKLYSQEKNILKKIYLLLLSKKLKKYETSILSKFDAIISITEQDKFIFEHYTQIPVFCSPAFVTINPINQIKCDTYSIYHLGSMEWLPNQQGIDWFINDVFPILKSNNNSFSLHIAGKNMPKKYKDLTIDGVKVYGEIDNALNFIKDKNIMIVPLQSGSGLRMKILEAMACKKCIVSTSIGVHGLDVENKKELLIANKKNDFANAIITIANNNENRNTIVNNAYQFVSNNYSSEVLIKKLLNYYTTLIQK